MGRRGSPFQGKRTPMPRCSAIWRFQAILVGLLLLCQLPTLPAPRDDLHPYPAGGAPLRLLAAGAGGAPFDLSISEKRCRAHRGDPLVFALHRPPDRPAMRGVWRSAADPGAGFLPGAARAVTAIRAPPLVSSPKTAVIYR